MMEGNSAHVQKDQIAAMMMSGRLALIPRELPAADMFPAHCSVNQERSTGSGGKEQHM